MCVTRKVLILLGLQFALFLAGSLASPGAQVQVYLGTYTESGSRGIYLSNLDLSTGELSSPSLVAETSSPSFLAFDPARRFLFAVNESSDKLSAFSIDPASGKLKFINDSATGGGGPCHLALDPSGKSLIAANYGGGSVSVFPVGADGRLGVRSQLIQLKGSGPNRGRQSESHAHSTTFVGKDLLLVDDLGGDKVMLFRVNGAQATLKPNDPPFATAPAGAGPRHLAIDRDHRFVYVVNEMGSSVTQFSLDPVKGVMRALRTVSALPPDVHGDNSGAEVALSPSGRTLYTSNRGEDAIAVFALDPATKAPRLIQSMPTGGKTPRNFAIDPDGKWLIAANQDSGNLVVLRIDAKSGKLLSTGRSTPLASPVCVLFR